MAESNAKHDREAAEKRVAVEAFRKHGFARAESRQAWKLVQTRGRYSLDNNIRAIVAHRGV